jgi:hypothetical protein
MIVISFNMLLAKDVAIDSTSVRDASVAWKLALIPGAGQIYNGDYHKAVGFWLSESYSIYKFNDYHKQGNELGKRNTYAWWVIGLYMMSILDAYIDAHLSTFPTEKNKDQNEKKK